MKVQGTHYRSIWYDYKDCQVKIIDQRWLPHDFRIVALTNLNEFAVAIRDMWVRGAPLIGATAAYGVAISLSDCLLYTSPSPRDAYVSRMPSSA